MTDSQHNNSTNLSRRKFLVKIAGITIGTFGLPGLSRGVAAEDAMQAVEAATDNEPMVRNLITKPTICGPNRGHLLWTEVNDEGEVQTMIWVAETEEEAEELLRFWKAARDYDSPDRLKQTPFVPVARTEQEWEHINAILAHPDNEGPWLDKYAAFLEQQVNPLGEFIRLDREWETLNEKNPDDPRLEALGKRWGELLDEYEETWCEPLGRITLRPLAMGHLYSQMWLEDGLFRNLDIEKPGILPEYADRFFDAVPLVKSLDFNCENLDCAGIAKLPQMTRIRELSLHNCGLDDEDFMHLASSRYLTNLRKLSLGSNQIGIEGVTALAKSPLLNSLTEFNFSGYSKLEPEAVHALAQTNGLTQLTSLDLGFFPLGEGRLELFREKLNSRRLKSLRLTQTGIQDGGVKVLAGCPHLEELDLDQCKLTAEGIRTLAALPFPKLKRLSLSFNDIGLEGVEALAEAEFLSSIEILDLSGCTIRSGLQSLADSPHLRSLQELKLSFCELSVEDVDHLVRSRSVKKLQLLCLDHNELPAIVARSLADTPHLSQLTELSLYECQLGLVGAKLLTSAKSLHNLESLRLKKDDVGKGADVLRDHFGGVLDLS